MTELPLTATEAASLLRAKLLSSVELTQACLNRTARLNDSLGVFLQIFEEGALAAARQADADFASGVVRSPLQGIPVAVKDLIAAREGPTTAQSLVLDAKWWSDQDATAVSRLRTAGAVILGKTTTMEFGAGIPDPTKPFPVPRNPWNLDTWAGGSSSGSASGVSAGLFYLALGTDTGGSIRLPAALCGVSGLMPTFGRVPKSGCVPFAYSVDRVGPLARSAVECADTLTVIAGFDVADPSSVRDTVPDFHLLTPDLRGLRIGVSRIDAHLGEPTEQSVSAAFEAALAVLSELGAELRPVAIELYDETVTAAMLTIASEAFAYHRNDMVHRWDDYFAGTKAQVALGALISAADYVQAQRMRRLAQSKLDRLLEQVDLIVTPTATVGAPTIVGNQLQIASMLGTVFTTFWNAVGNPVLAVPIGTNDQGMPVSLQIVGGLFEEALLTRVGSAYQSATDWHLQMPPLHGLR